jgi:chaperonin GroEL
MVKEAAVRTGDIAGDGTTTATVLAHAIVSAGLQAVASGCNPVALKRGIDRAVAAVVGALVRQARQVEGRADLERVATVAGNHDVAIGALIADALERVGRHGVVTVEDGRAFDTTLHVVDGLRLDNGYLSPYFVTDPETMEAVLDDAWVLLAEHRLAAVKDVVAAMECAAQSARPILALAEDIEGEALATLVVNRLRGSVGSVAVRAPGVGDARRDLLEDLAVWTGARVLSPSAGDAMDRVTQADLGRVRHVVADRDHVTLTEGGGDPAAVRSRIAQLEGELERADSDYDRDRLRNRIARLTGGVGVLRVGAASELEMRERRSRIEDALAATQSAVEEGIVVGGGVALVRAQDDVRGLALAGEEKMGADIVLRALEEPARQIAINAGEEGAVVIERIRGGSDAFGFDALPGRYGDLRAWGIMDPAKVVRCALQHAASIATLLLTTDAVVVDAPPDEEPADPPES